MFHVQAQNVASDNSSQVKHCTERVQGNFKLSLYLISNDSIRTSGFSLSLLFLADDAWTEEIDHPDNERQVLSRFLGTFPPRKQHATGKNLENLSTELP